MNRKTIEEELMKPTKLHGLVSMIIYIYIIYIYIYIYIYIQKNGYDVFVLGYQS